MNVVRASLVVSRYDGVEDGDAVLVGHLDTAERRCIDNGLIGGVAVAGVEENAAVDTLQSVSNLSMQGFPEDRVLTYSRVAAPEVDGRLRNGLARLDVDDLDVNRHLDTAFAIRHVTADLLATDVYAEGLVSRIAHFYGSRCP